VADPNAEYNAAAHRAKAGDKMAKRKLARLEKKRLKALAQRKKKGQ
jgi:hypothetical protein